MPVERYQLLECPAQAGVFGEGAGGQEFPEIVHSVRDALEKMRPPLEHAPESVGPEHLECPEEDELPQVGQEVLPAHHLIVRLCLEICLGQFGLELGRVAGPRLPYEGGQVIVDRSHPSALEVDEFHFLRGCEHDVPALEVPVLEVPGTAHQQPVAQPD